ncbi:MAG: BFD-like (2Fe-2S) protein [Desulfovibrionales bacterium GWA2_65_9]|nr:MAG: BFD-like (2Fe-2S) protein [Desulfovibrionales bacterium GWA2_65_9]
MEDLVCHCFGYTAKDIEQDLAEHGRSTLIERIHATLKAGASQCATRHPKGR